MTWANISTVLGFLWWGFWLALLGCVLIGAAWSRRPWREDPAMGWRKFQAGKARAFEAQELDKLEGEGGQLWRPKGPRR